MAISFVGSLPTVGANNGGNVTLTFSNLRDTSGAQPTLQQGDVVVCAYACSGTADHAMSTSSSDWTEVSPEAYADGTIDTNLAVYYKVMGASPDTQFVGVGPTGASNGTIGVAMAFRGLNSAVLDVAVPTPATGTATSVPNAPSIAPSTAGAWIVVVGAGAAGAGASYSNSDLSSGSNHFRTGNHPETNDIAIGMGFKSDWVSGAFDPAAWTGGNVNASNSWAAFTLALKPDTAQTLSPSLFTNTQTFHGPTVTPGTVTLSPALATNTQSFFAATVSASITLSPALLTNTQTFYAANIEQAGPQTLSPSLLTNTQTFHAPTITASIDLAASLLENTQVFYGPTITVGAVTLSPPLLVNISAFFESAITIDGKRFARRYPSNNFRNYMWRR
jgi:hypothetical protein